MSILLAAVGGQGGVVVPGVPGTLSLAAGGRPSTEINLSWSAPSDTGGGTISGYRIKKDGSVLVADTSSTGTTYTATGLTRVTEYNFNVAAINEKGTGADGNTPALTTSAVVPGAPGTLSLAAGTDANTQINLSWSAPSDTGGATITGYRIKKDGSVLVADTSSTGTTYTASGLTGNTSYNFNVAAINSIGTGADGNTPSRTTTNTFGYTTTGSPTFTEYSGYESLMWTGTGSLVVSNAGGTSIDIFLSAGGGGGGSAVGGGGGTGGVREDTGNALSATSYTVTVGGGGGSNGNGGTSSFGSIVSNTGGGAGRNNAGNAGGAGGGGGGSNPTQFWDGGAGTSGQGGDGGRGSAGIYGSFYAGGGGGGKDSVDGGGADMQGGNGGAGFNTNTYFDGTTDNYGGGGGGGATPHATGAAGATNGGAGGNGAGSSAPANKGGGDGGGGTGAGGSGAGGFVIIRWSV